MESLYKYRAGYQDRIGSVGPWPLSAQVTGAKLATHTQGHRSHTGPFRWHQHNTKDYHTLGYVEIMLSS